MSCSVLSLFSVFRMIFSSVACITYFMIDLFIWLTSAQSDQIIASFADKIVYCLYVEQETNYLKMKVKRMQRSGTEAITHKTKTGNN